MNKDNKNETLNDSTDQKDQGIKIDFKPSGEKVDPFVVKKSAEQIKIETKDADNTNPGIDINAANLGVFADDTEAGNSFAPAKTITPLTEAEKNMDTKDIQVLSAIEEKKESDDVLDKKSKDAKIDFEKFERTKSSRSSNNGLTVKFDIWLRTPKKLLLIWITAIATIAIILAVQITLVVLNTKVIKIGAKSGNGMISWPPIHACGIAGNVFSYISIFATVPTFLFLLTSWVIGINGVYRSRVFHLFLWSLICVALVSMILSCILSGIDLYWYYDFHV